MVTISRAVMALEFPCNFLLVCAMNPCPCGYLGDPGRRCRCGPHEVRKYRSRISGPLLDRIDLQVDVPVAPFERLVEQRRGESSAAVRERVQAARERQLARFAGTPTRSNGEMTPKQIEAAEFAWGPGPPKADCNCCARPRNSWASRPAPTPAS